ncbi:NifU family protein [Sporolactobacillus sp. CQH2019]|uniref:NifU family protein n=1 Tax=Sporolactobacillus sp. CQH2019 TaxID=3023512 RepID=UPI002367954B|nr:NifU family protein [Sporolactobacillus sp. CQH2019]MDD9150242.1 NifU family protein [Sporolactobacillus sp. CQH2019]
MMENEMIEKIERTLDEKIRPALALHKGNVKIVNLKGNVLRMRMLGACRGCPSATLTLESLIEDEVRTAFPKIRKVEFESGVSDSLIKQARFLMEFRRAQ